MRALKLIGILAWTALAGCAMQPIGESVLQPATVTTGVESIERTRARVHTELAAGYYELGNISVALEEAKEALRSDVNYGPAYNIAGLVYAQLKEDRLAEDYFRRALQINPLDHDANHNYGEFLCQRKKEEEAIRYFLAAVRNPLYLNPARSYVNAGVCARRRGDTAGAQEFLQTALKLRPNQPQALFQMADIAYANGDYAGSRDYLNRLMNVTQANAETLWLGVRVERRLGDRNAEASYALQLRKNFPQSREARALSIGRIE